MTCLIIPEIIKIAPLWKSGWSFLVSNMNEVARILTLCSENYYASVLSASIMSLAWYWMAELGRVAT